MTRMRRWVAGLLSGLVLAGAVQGGEGKPVDGDGVRNFRFGDLLVTALADRREIVPVDSRPELFLNASPEEIRDIAPKGDIESSINVFLIRGRGRVMLVDAGLGVRAGGTMMANLAVAGAKPEEITDILMTHLHGDHCGGLVGADGKAAFPNATLWLSQAEYDYWTSDEERDAAPEAKRGGFANARAALAVMEGKTQKIAWKDIGNDTDAQLADGSALRMVGAVTSGESDRIAEVISLAGHTPGQAGFGFGSPGTGIVFWGDLMHRVELQAKRPDIALTYDVDPVLAVKTRLEFLDFLEQASRHGTAMVAGAHLPFPGIGSFDKSPDGQGYVYIPANPLPSTK